MKIQPTSLHFQGVTSGVSSLPQTYLQAPQQTQAYADSDYAAAPTEEMYPASYPQQNYGKQTFGDKVKKSLQGIKRWLAAHWKAVLAFMALLGAASGGIWWWRRSGVTSAADEVNQSYSHPQGINSTTSTPVRDSLDTDFKAKLDKFEAAEREKNKLIYDKEKPKVVKELVAGAVGAAVGTGSGIGIYAAAPLIVETMGISALTAVTTFLGLPVVPYIATVLMPVIGFAAIAKARGNRIRPLILRPNENNRNAKRVVRQYKEAKQAL